MKTAKERAVIQTRAADFFVRAAAKLATNNQPGYQDAISVMPQVTPLPRIA